jgi:hypothetical protein
MQAIAMILGRKICFAPPCSICGFFSISLIEESRESLSSFIVVRSPSTAALIVVAAIFHGKDVKIEVKLNYAGTPWAFKPTYITP